jgi:hypothetical protein
MTTPENGNALLRLAGRKAKASLASCIPSRIALNHSHAMRTQKTPDWKRQKTGLSAGPVNGCELVDGPFRIGANFANPFGISTAPYSLSDLANFKQLGLL